MVLPRIWHCAAAFGVVNVWLLLLFPRSPLRSALPGHKLGGVVQNRGPAGPLVWPFQGGWGEQAKRRQRQMKRACFEEAARLATPKRDRESQCRDGVKFGIPLRFTSTQRNEPRMTGR